MTVKGAVSRAHNESAAFQAVTMGQLDKLDAALLSRCHGVDLERVQQMIEAGRAREAGRG